MREESCEKHLELEEVMEQGGLRGAVQSAAADADAGGIVQEGWTIALAASRG